MTTKGPRPPIPDPDVQQEILNRLGQVVEGDTAFSKRVQEVLDQMSGASLGVGPLDQAAVREELERLRNDQERIKHYKVVLESAQHKREMARRRTRQQRLVRWQNALLATMPFFLTASWALAGRPWDWAALGTAAALAAWLGLVVNLALQRRNVRSFLNHGVRAGSPPAAPAEGAKPTPPAPKAKRGA